MFGSKSQQASPPQPTTTPVVPPEAQAIQAQAAQDAEQRKRAQMAQAVMSMTRQQQGRGPTTSAGATAQALSNGVQAYIAAQARDPKQQSYSFGESNLGQLFKKFSE